jgi:hypothetical protein
VSLLHVGQSNLRPGGDVPDVLAGVRNVNAFNTAAARRARSRMRFAGLMDSSARRAKRAISGRNSESCVISVLAV